MRRAFIIAMVLIAVNNAIADSMALGLLLALLLSYRAG